ncbi:hypothetical protein NDU88_006337, partial [Pleurodeles waltl]
HPMARGLLGTQLPPRPAPGPQQMVLLAPTSSATTSTSQPGMSEEVQLVERGSPSGGRVK